MLKMNIKTLYEIKEKNKITELLESILQNTENLSDNIKEEIIYNFINKVVEDDNAFD